MTPTSRARRPALLLAAALAAVAVLAVGVRPAAADLPADLQVDQVEACGQCHDLSTQLESKVRHEPAASGECATCHNPHASRFDALQRERPGAVCAECHTDVAATLDKPVVHPPAADGRCAACHDPHGSSRPALLRASGGELCLTCHDEVGAWQKRPVQHVPFAKGDCARCHEPHASESPGLLKAAGAAVCTQCHDTRTGAFRNAHSGYPVEKASCQQCHDPHASARRGLFRDTMHPPFADGDCTTCHNDPGSAQPFATALPLAELCGMCHEDQVEAAKAAPFPHVPAGGGDCAACHNPHTGSGPALLREDEQTLCLSCHDPGGSKSGLDGRFRTHAGGALDCTSCHQGHGGAQPLLLKSDPIELCGECHSHQHQAVHPLGEEVRDPRNGQPMTCRSCHGVHDAPYPKYLVRSGERDLCLSCHKEIGGQR